MTIIILQAGWAGLLMDRVARRAVTGRLLHMSGRATQRAAAAVQARPMAPRATLRPIVSLLGPKLKY
jgi:hypothetical protein